MFFSDKGFCRPTAVATATPAIGIGGGDGHGGHHGDEEEEDHLFPVKVRVAWWFLFPRGFFLFLTVALLCLSLHHVPEG
jgi:hypothetical protein